MLLGLDLGTTNVKAVLVRPGEGIVARGSAPVALRHVGKAGVEQDMDDVWSAVLAAVAEAGRQASLSSVQAVGVSSQGGALQVLDADGQPDGPVVSWLDGRARQVQERVTRELGSDWLCAHTGHGRLGLVPGHLLRLREEGAALGGNVAFVGDVIVGRLCGRRAHDATSLSIAGLLNPGLGRADADLLARLGIGEHRLPDLLPAHVAAGRVSAEGARQTGLPAGIPVSPAVHDQYAASLGAGAVRAGDVMLGAGTAWVLLALAAEAPGALVPVIVQAFACPHPVAGLCAQMLSMVNGGSAFHWAVRTLGLEGRPASELDRMMDSVPAGCDGVRFRPLLVPGGAAGLPAGMPGQLDGLRLAHTPAHILRAVIEGLALELTRHLRFLTGGGIVVDRLALCGGAAGSSVTPQILADATGVPVACVTETAVSALGAAVPARAIVEGTADLQRLADECAPAARLVRPGPHEPVYRAMSERYAASLPHVGTEAH
ncbi:MAG: FGGY-family carbohydrate kinase [Candidatus Brocadiaceae bacterium]|nr:FGGY-family carbohydrate kinase [Candidatus Brocadiaceae bacterium]